MTSRRAPAPDELCLVVAKQYFAFGRVKGLWWVRGTRPELRQVGLVSVPVVGAVAVGA